MMSRLHWYIVFLWVYHLYDTDGKGGGGGSESTSLVTISQDGDATIGGQLSLTCDFPVVTKPQSLFWFRGNDIIYANDHIVWMLDSITASTEDFTSTKRHHLIIQDMDLNDGGLYTCLVKTVHGKEEEGELDVSISPDSVVVKLNESPILQCEHFGAITYPKILIWKKNKEILAINRTILHSNGQYTLQRSNLVISNMTSSDEGTYTCYSDGKRVHSYLVSIYQPPSPNTSLLRGWRGYTFGVALGLLIIATLAMAAFIQNRPFKGSDFTEKI